MAKCRSAHGVAPSPQDLRIADHPILDFPAGRPVEFTCNGATMTGHEGEPIIVALRANGVVKVRESTKSHLPWGPFCMQGRCCSCMMTVDGLPNTMTCVTPLKAGMVVQSPDAERDTGYFKRLPDRKADLPPPPPEGMGHREYDVAVIGAGPAGLEAALMAAEAGCGRVGLFDDKEYLGGQLRLQTHDFFGTEALGASKRGFQIAEELASRVLQTAIDVRLGATVVGMYPSNAFAFRDKDKLNFATARKIVLATGASEKMLPFPGNYLPGVIGAGAAQTFMNIYGVRPGRRVLIVGAGNIGVILAYQLLQAGVHVVEVIEAGPRPGAYGVHVEKIRALGVPVRTRHTIRAALGTDAVEAAEVVELDESWQEVPGSARVLAVDTVCVAVGLNPLSELLWQAGCDFTTVPELGEVPTFNRYRRASSPDLFVAGDCAVIGEASIARLEGRLAGLTAARDLGHKHPDFEAHVKEAFGLLDAIQSGACGERLGAGKARVMGDKPHVFAMQKFRQGLRASDVRDPGKPKVLVECPQDIPCNPCEASCRYGAIRVGAEINQPPDVDLEKCVGCGQCIARCPGRAIRMVRFDAGDGKAEVHLPWEFAPAPAAGASIPLCDREGLELGQGEVVKVRNADDKLKCTVVVVRVPAAIAERVRSTPPPLKPLPEPAPCSCHEGGEALVCRCEEVALSTLLDTLKQGYSSINEVKRLLRCEMGPCRGLSCRSIIEGYLKSVEKKAPAEILETKRQRRSIFRPPTKRITLAEAARLSFTESEVRTFIDIEERRTLPQEEVDAFRWEEVPLKRTQRRRCVVIGGGIAGVMTAWNLAREGWDGVTVVEKEFLAAGATGASLGGVRTGFAGLNKVARARKGLELFRDAEKLIGKSVGWFQGGYVYLAFDDKMARSFRELVPVWDEGGVPYEFLETQADLTRHVPGIDASNVTLGVFFPEAGGANPFLATFRFAEDARDMGVEFLCGREVRDVEVEGGAVQGVRLSDGTGITCEHVVNAAGSFAVRASRMVGIDLAPDFWIERHGAFITEKVPLWLDPLVVSYHPSLSGYWQQKRMEPGVTDGEIVACYSPQDPIHGYNTNSYIYFLARMAKSILTVQPGLGELGIVRNSANHYVCRKSGVPLIGPTSVKGFWHNIAKAGHGFMCAPGDGFALAKTMVEGRLHPWITECTLEEGAERETMK